MASLKQGSQKSRYLQWESVICCFATANKWNWRYGVKQCSSESCTNNLLYCCPFIIQTGFALHVHGPHQCLLKKQYWGLSLSWVLCFKKRPFLAFNNMFDKASLVIHSAKENKTVLQRFNNSWLIKSWNNDKTVCDNEAFHQNSQQDK